MCYIYKIVLYCIVSLKPFMAHVQREEETAHFTYGEEVLHCLLWFYSKTLIS